MKKNTILSNLFLLHMHRLFYRCQKTRLPSLFACKGSPYNAVKHSKTLLYFTSLFAALLLAAAPVFAGSIPVVDVFDGAKAELVNGKIKEIKDNMYFTNKAIIVSPAAKDIITFKINEESKLVLKTAFTATVTFRLTYTDKNNVATQVGADQTLTINYDPAKDKTYKAYSDFIFDNAYGIKIQITKPIQFSPANPGWDPTPALQLSMEIQPNHLYQFDRVQNAVPQFTGTAVLNGAMAVADELAVAWDAVTGASEYDLEWTYVDDLAAPDVINLINSSNPSDADLDRLVYRNNATRVTLNDVTKIYSIPLFYDGKGTLVYRIRSAQSRPNGQRLEAVWSKTAFFKYDGHQSRLNWQASTSFAEEGKRKTVLQYFDGSLRNRQTVTKDNSTGTTVVAETIYDYQGRPAVQVLPAPTLNNLITYTPNFNTLNNASYDKDNFDLLSASRNICKTPAAPLDNQSGAAQYYAASNPLLTNTELLKKEPFHQYIPDAQGYPFTETQYLQDGTGRIYKQSGVGAQYQMGSGHETTYYYGNPDQQELDALFGTEAGDASHYFKNMVKDANGQYSVSYADMHGRTIATALAGDILNSSLSNLPSNTSRLKVSKILTDKNNNIVKGWTIESSKGLVVTKAGTNVFTYSFDPSSLVLPACPPGSQNIYYDCLYDLEITITGDCNNEFNGGQPFVVKKSNFTLGQIDVTAQPAEKFLLTFNKDLLEGSYTVTKKLTISTDGLNFYRDQVFLKNNVCKTLDQFIQEQKDIFAQLQLNCNPTSASCRLKLGSPAEFRNAYLSSNGIIAPTATDEQAITIAYNNAQKECDRLAANEKNGQNDIQGIYQSMLADVTPGGQYANLDLIDNYSVFSQIPNTSLYKYANSTYMYKDEFGNNYTVTGTYDAPAYENANKFIADFKPTWSETLVQAHPEYCKYAVMRDQVGDASYTWDNDFLQTKTYAEAQAKGYLNPTGNAAFVTKYPTQFKINAANIDPLALINPGYKSSIEGFLDIAFGSGGDVASLWTAASGAGFCKNNNDQACINKQKVNPFDETVVNCKVDLDMAWVSFRGMYYAQKRKLIRDILNNACTIDYTDLTKTIQAGPPDDPINFQHTVYFDDPIKKINTATGLPGFDGAIIQGLTPEQMAAQIENQKQQGYATACSGYSSLWWSQLAPCVTDKLEPQKTNIINDLVKICTLGSDDNHISGSSSINPAKTNAYKNFEEVIKFYISQYNATAAVADKIDPVTCNGLLITYPLPYEAPLPINKPIFKKQDDCDCERIALIRSKYNNLPAAGKDATFSDYLLRTQHTTISNADLDLLTSLCTGTYECNFLAKPVILPPGLQCGAGDVCVSCDRVNQVYNAFKRDYPGIIPAITDVDEPQRSYNQLFAKYMNNRLGFGKQADEYLTFMSSCGVTGTNTTATCETLQKILSDYKTNQNQVAGSCDTIHFTVYGNNGNQTIFTDRLSEIYANGYAHIPRSISDVSVHAGEGLVVKKYDTLCVNNNFTIETRLKGDSIDMLGPRYCKALNFVFWDENNTVFSPTFEMPGIDPASCGTGAFYCDNGTCRWDTTNLKMYQRNMLDWFKIKMVVKNNLTSIYVNDSLINSIPYTTPINKIVKYAHGIKNGYVDYVKVFDANGTLQYNEEFEDCKQSASNTPVAFSCGNTCQNGFAAYYNQRNNTSYTYSQIDSIYNSTCGKSPDVCSVPQQDTCARNLTFIKTYGTATGSSGVNDLVQTADGGYVFTGSTTAFDVSGNDAFITKVNRTGDIEWSKTYGKNYDDYLWHIKSTTDSGFVAIGAINTVGLQHGEIWVLKIDKNGNKQWSKKINAGTFYGEVGNYIIQTSDGGYALNGYYQFQSGIVDWIVIKLNSAGDIIWNKRFGTNNSDQPGAIVEDGDSLVLTGLHYSSALGNPFTYYDGILMKISKYNGAVGWLKSYDIESKSNWFIDLYKNNNGYSIFTFTANDFYATDLYGTMLKVSPNGEPIQSVKVARANPLYSNYGNVSIRPVQDGGFVIAESPDVNGDIFIQKTDSSGNFVWANQVKLPGNQIPGQVIQTADGSFAVAGASDAGNLLIKTNLLGKTLCSDSSVTITNSFPTNKVYTRSLFYDTTAILTISDVDGIGIARVFTPSTFCINDPCAPAAVGPFLCGRNEALVKEIDNYHEDTPCDDQLQFSTSRGMEQYKIYTEKITGEFTNNYIAECLKAVSNEIFKVEQDVSEYHYTLYYYDQAGNLIKTVPPAGVKADYSPEWMLAVKTAREAHTENPQLHTLVTQYRYNTLNQVIAQNTPDAKLSEFWYDRLGRLAISQNAKQKLAANNYSYTKYDYLGRIAEVGQINAPVTAMTDAISRFPVQLGNWFTSNAAKRQQITLTQYDLPGSLDLSLYVTINTRNLRNRVSFTSFTNGNNPVNYNAATYYNYDIHGNVSTLLQDYTTASIMGANSQQFKRMDYQYDLISGKVNEVAYQNGYKDQFFHRYTYDAENRLTAAYTSMDYTRWEQDANYQYYRHGPLARTELGNQHVQGLDYAYTLQGWLKAVNGTVLNASGGGADMGGDGGINNNTRAQDVYGYSLQYNDADYQAIGNPQWLTGVKNQLPAINGYRPLFNGNISSMAVNLPVNAGARGGAPMLYNYSYDQLNRLVGMNAFTGNNTGNQLWDNSLTATDQWKEAISYDANGNILSYLRNGTTAGSKLTGMDNLQYGYNKDLNGNLVNNRLRHVKDDPSLSGNYTEDIDTQLDDNYTYDAIGNLVTDNAEKITAINWSVYGKILSIAKTATTTNPIQTITYTYDAAGNRISKAVKKQGVAALNNTWYVRDASGNVMAVYGLGDNTINSGRITLREQHLYGSSRLGIRNPNTDVTSLLVTYNTTPISTTTKSFYSSFDRGNKFFELSNHLGNVLVTISDKKIGHTTDNTTIDYYNADIASANDYAPFGMQMVGRTFSSGGYRYGFNGKENDNEVKGQGNQQDYGLRIYDPRLGKFLSVDPFTQNFPWNSVYAYSENDPVNFTDLDGGERAPSAAQAVLIPAVPIEKVVIDQSIKKLAEEMAEQAAKKGGSAVAEKAAERGSLRLLPYLGKAGGLLIGFLLSPLEAGTRKPDHIPEGYYWGGDYLLKKPDNKPVLLPDPKPKLDPRTVPPPDKDDEDGAHLYKTLDNQKNTGQGGLGYVANKMNAPIPYIGITTDALLGGRYSPLSLRGANSEIIGTDRFTTVAGAETAVIALNTYGVNYKLHLGNLQDKDVRASTRVANLRFSYKNPVWIAAGIQWLNVMRPGWDKPGNKNSLLFSENKKGSNSPTP